MEDISSFTIENRSSSSSNAMTMNNNHQQQQHGNDHMNNIVNHFNIATMSDRQFNESLDALIDVPFGMGITTMTPSPPLTPTPGIVDSSSFTKTMIHDNNHQVMNNNNNNVTTTTSNIFNTMTSTTTTSTAQAIPVQQQLHETDLRDIRGATKRITA